MQGAGGRWAAAGLGHGLLVQPLGSPWAMRCRQQAECRDHHRWRRPRVVWLPDRHGPFGCPYQAQVRVGVCSFSFQANGEGCGSMCAGGHRGSNGSEPRACSAWQRVRQLMRVLVDDAP